jgi:parallel beta-helix repeat protein
MKKPYFIPVLILTVAVIATFPAIVSAAGNTYYVATTGSDATGSGTAVDPWATIQYAIDQASSDDTIIVEAGTYNEDVNIDKSLAVLSADGAATTIIDAQGADFGVLIDGVGTVATIDGFTVRNYEVGGIVAGAFSLEDDPTEVHILSNIVEEPLPEDVHNNCIQVGDGTTGTIVGNEVSGARLVSTDWSGSGIIVAGSSNVLFSDNYVHNCELGICVVGYAVARSAPAANNIIENNRVEDNDCGISIQMNAINTIIKCNDVTNNEIGIESAGNISWEPTVPSGTEVHGNTITGNTDKGAASSVWDDSLGDPEQLDATLNWWGATSGPTHASNPTGTGNEVSDYVDFDPWLTASPPAIVESADSGGNTRDIFGLAEPAYVTGSGYGISKTHDLYVVDDVTSWSNGMTIPSRVTGTETSVTTDSNGDIPVGTLAWSSGAVGQYDIVVDVNGNGKYDECLDALDDGDIKVTAGFHVIPEIPLGTAAALLTALAALVAYKKRAAIKT